MNSFATSLTLDMLAWTYQIKNKRSLKKRLQLIFDALIRYGHNLTAQHPERNWGEGGFKMTHFCE